MRTGLGLALVGVLALAPPAVQAEHHPPPPGEPPMLAAAVAAGKLPPAVRRLPDEPAVVVLRRPGLEPGQYGGTLRMLIGGTKDVRMMTVYGYSRLVGYDRDFDLAPDLIERFEVENDRVFTLRLRAGHKWSDGHPFTAEDFRYFWEDIATNAEMSPAGPPKTLMVDGEPARFQILDARTVRYTWSKPNPYFLPELAGAMPLFIYRPAHFLKQFHARYADRAELARKVEAAGQRNWVALHVRQDRQYAFDNPDLPTLEPWITMTRPPAQRFIFARNPYYHRVDERGRQLPFIDRVIMTVVSAKLIPAKAGAGEVDLQARSLQFNNYTFLKQGEKRNDYKVRLWQSAKGAHMALFPNLNATDPEWRRLFRNADFRRALSLATNRHEINQVIYFGLAIENNNTVLPQSPLYRPEYGRQWAEYDPRRADRLLDGLGLTRRDDRGVRLLPDGRPMDLIVETAGEESEQADVLGLVGDGWLKVGIKLHIKPSQREVFRNRVFAGSTLMAVWSGLENALPTPESSPEELAPTSQQQLQWPKWGQYFETGGKAGEPVDLEAAQALVRLNEEWRMAGNRARKAEIWHAMLKIHADQVFSIGLVCGVPQPVVISNRLRNVPEAGVYNWDPGAFFGIYSPDTFWFADNADTAAAK